MPEDVQFSSEGTTVRGHLYRPPGDGPFPIVVMAGGWCYVKELVQPTYARAFVDQGCAALVFDYRNFGESDGTPRQHLDPWRQIEDYRNAISYAETLDLVDKDRIGVWGISYSGGHALVVGATDPRVRAIVSTIPVVDGWETMQRVHGGLGFRRLRETVLRDRRSRYAGGEHGTMPMSSKDPAAEVSVWPFPEVTSGFEGLKATDAPNHEHWNTVQSVELLWNYTVFPYVRRILDTPTLMIVAENDDITSWDLEIEAFHGIPTTKKQLFVMNDTSHMVLYTNKSHLELAAEKGARFFGEQLRGRS
jgi:pimeloyl-ACP methyl ester carboxylesterase